MIYILLILSLLFESLISLIINISFLQSCFLLTTLLLIYPFYRNKKLKYIIICFICGLLYDILFTNTMFINTISYVLYGLFIDLLYKYIDYNIFSFNFINLLGITFYRMIVYILLSILDYFEFNLGVLCSGIINSMILNFIYGLILYTIINKKRTKIKYTHMRH